MRPAIPPPAAVLGAVRQVVIATISLLRAPLRRLAGGAVPVLLALAGSAAGQAANPEGKTILRFQASNEWLAVDMSDLQVRPGSAMDLSSWPPRRACERLLVAPSGKLATASQPETPFRLLGFNGVLPGCFQYQVAPEKLPQAMENHLRGIRVQGYNVVRMGIDRICANSDPGLDREQLDRLDHYLAQLRANGIYVQLLLGGGGNYLPRADKAVEIQYKTRMYLGDPELRAAWQAGVRTLLQHVNPYTGLAWKDDPTIACVESTNEQEFGFDKRFLTRLSPPVLAAFNVRFRAFLEAQYQTPAALARAWGQPQLQSFAEAAIPASGFNGESPQVRDYAALCNLLARECAQWYEATLREAGYQGLCGQYDLPLWFGDNLVRYESSQVAFRHDYFQHPSDQTNPGSKCDIASSSVGAATGYWRATNTARFADRPFFVTEYNHSFFNRYQHEAGIVFGAYSALQGFDALMVHASAVATAARIGEHWDSWSVNCNPIARANEFVSACLFLRGDVQPARHRVELAVSREQMQSRSYGALTSEQSKLGLLSGFSISFLGAQRPRGVGNPPPADLVIAPSGEAMVEASEWAAEAVDTKAGDFALADFVPQMKAKGILPAANLSDPANGVFQSETGEILLRAQENLLKVVTARSEAVTLEGNKGEALGVLTIANTSTAACIAACAIDGKGLADSQRIVLVYATQAANSGMALATGDGRNAVLLDHGRLPVLLKAGRLAASLNNRHAASLALYALKMTGERREKLPVTVTEGTLSFVLDTARLPAGPTVFFELAAE